MVEEKQEIHKNNERVFNVFEFIIELIGWIQIVASPLFIGLIIGSIIYFPRPSSVRLVLAIIIATSGLILGIIMATKKWKGKGTTYFLSRIMATPELDNLDEGNKKHKKSSEDN